MNRLTYAIAEFFINFSDWILPQVISILIALIIFGVLFMLRRKIVTCFLTFIKKLFSRIPHMDEILDGFTRPLVVLVASTGGYIALHILLQRFGWVAALGFVTTVFRSLVIIMLAWGLLGATSPVITALKGGDSVLDKTIVTFLSNIVKVLIGVLAVVMVLDAFDFDITGLITGLGITGLTVALAAQDTAGNLFGGLVILADKPFAVGDWIQTSSVEGVVEDISLRSTRIRTFKDAVIVVPNSSISSSEIINWSRMNKRKVEMTLGLTYQTSRETLQAVLGGIRKLLQEEETVSTPPVVTFAGFGASSLDITVNYFIDRTTLAEYNEVKEAINFKIMELCENLGAEFAYPTQTLFVEQSEIKPLNNGQQAGRRESNV